MRRRSVADRQLSPEQELALLDHLERRRDGHAAAMWQAPGLTIAAQAFLLQVLANGGIPLGARLVVLAAGVSASLVAVYALYRMQYREVQYAEAFAHFSADVIPDIRPAALPPRPERKPAGRYARFDAWALRQAARDGTPRGHFLWGVPLLLFALADVAVCLTA